MSISFLSRLVGLHNNNYVLLEATSLWFEKLWFDCFDDFLDYNVG